MVRLDLPLGVLAAQLIHAAGEAGPTEPGTYAVALGAQNEQHLEEIAQRLTAEQLRFVRIVESEGAHRGQLMALGLYPGPKHTTGRPLGALPLITLPRFLEAQTKGGND